MHFNTPLDVQLSEDFVLDAIKFSRRMGNYLYLPVFLVCGFCSLVILAYDIRPQEVRALELFAPSAVVTFILWRLSRVPRAKLFLVEGVLFAALTIVWVGWFIFNLVFRLPTFWPNLLHVSYFLVVSTGMGTASIKCFRLWSKLRAMDDYHFQSVLERTLPLARSSDRGGGLKTI
jgi:hypothetical protein